MKNDELRMKNEECRPDGNSSFRGEADILHQTTILHSSFLILHLKRANFPFTNLPSQFAGSSFSLLLSGFLFFFNRFRINRITFKITSIHFILFIYDFTIYDFTIYDFTIYDLLFLPFSYHFDQDIFSPVPGLLQACKQLVESTAGHA